MGNPEYPRQDIRPCILSRSWLIWKFELWHLYGKLTISTLIIHNNVTCCQISIKQTQMKVKFGVVTNIDIIGLQYKCTYQLSVSISVSEPNLTLIWVCFTPVWSYVNFLWIINEENINFQYKCHSSTLHININPA